MATSPFYNQTFFDPTPVNGVTVAASNGYLKVFAQGSSTLANIWVDAALSIPQANPLAFNGAGQCPQYFVNDGQALDYKAFTSDARVIMTALNVTASSGTGGGTGDHKVATDVGDTAPDYLEAKLLTSTSVRFSLVSPGGVHLMTAQVDEGWLAYWITEQGYGSSDHKALADGSPGDVPAYLVAKFVDATGSPLTVNEAHQLVLPFARLDGAEFTGSVIVDGQLQSLGNTSLAAGPGATLLVSGPATMGVAAISDLKLPLLTPGDWLALDSAGNVVAVTPPTSDHKVLYDLSDAIPGFLGVKVQAGSGIQVNVTTDGTNGKVMHVNVQPGYFARTIYKSILASAGLSGSTPITLLQGVVPAIPKNTLAVGDVIRIKTMCSVDSGAGILGMGVYSNGIQLFGGTGFSSGFNGFNMEYTITILSLGPIGSVDVNASGYSAAGQFSFGNYSNSIDTTVDNILDVKANTDTTVTLTNTVCTIERL